MVSLRDAEEIMIAELQITEDEARIYLLLLSKGKMAREKIVEETNLEVSLVDNALKGLGDKGTVIEMNGEFEALNPRFAVTNMYRMMCYASNQEVKRNPMVDQLATMLEKAYEDARTK
jgi:sugar-specific transcriptional regulator TrmB